MKKLAFLALAALVAAPAAARADDNPIAPLKDVGRHLNEGMAAFLKGAEPAEACKPWIVGAPEPDALARMRKEMKAAGVASAVNAGFEFGVCVTGKGRPDACLVKTLVFADAGEASFLEIRAKPEDARMVPTLAPALDRLKDREQPFVVAASAFVEWLKGRRGRRGARASPHGREEGPCRPLRRLAGEGEGRGARGRAGERGVGGGPRSPRWLRDPACVRPHRRPEVRRPRRGRQGRRPRHRLVPLRGGEAPLPAQALREALTAYSYRSASIGSSAAAAGDSARYTGRPSSRAARFWGASRLTKRVSGSRAWNQSAVRRCARSNERGVAATGMRRPRHSALCKSAAASRFSREKRTRLRVVSSTRMELDSH